MTDWGQIAATPRFSARTSSGLRAGIFAVFLLVVATLCSWTLESRFSGLSVSNVTIGGTPVTIYRRADEEPRPLVVVAHGFSGSRQMMDQISVTLARSGLHVASLDLPGHGRNPEPLSADVMSLDGATAQLVDRVLKVTEAMRVRSDVSGPVSFVGHSMATDIVIRAAVKTDGVGAVGAVSMYSTAVSASAPRNLLIVSGAAEGHLREVALAALQQVAAGAGEGETATADGVARRAISAPRVGHVGVLYHSATLEELADWITRGSEIESVAQPDQTGAAAGALLLALTLLAWPLSRMLPLKDEFEAAPPRRVFLAAIFLPALLSVPAALLVPHGWAGAAGIGSIAAAIAVWGGAQLVVLRHFGVRIAAPDALGALAVLALGGVFAMALDRYGAAFMPTGFRLTIMMSLLPGAIALMIADVRLSIGAPLWRRVVARIVLLLGFAAMMLSNPDEIGLTFTVIPVTLLFFFVYGSIARAVALRRGSGIGAATGIAFAWALAASTPIFA